MEQTTTPKNKRRFTGTVVSDKMQKTRVVEIALKKIHPRYRKHYTSRRRIKVHDERNESKQGDRVMIEETRPLSKDKRFTLVSILK